MSRRLLFDVLYRLGRQPWDTPPPDELRHAIEGPHALSPGHALDVGCGTGTNAIYLARHGWQVTGVDFSSAAIDKARDKAAGVSGPQFMRGDATRLSELPIPRPVDLVLDMGTFHTLSDEGKAEYVRELAAVMTYAKNRDLRKTLFMAFNTKCAKGDELDNQDIIKQLVALRHQRAQLLGYESHAHFTLEERMAKSPAYSPWAPEFG